jgi:DNA-binding transcriptional ArsR family regulator
VSWRDEPGEIAIRLGDEDTIAVRVAVSPIATLLSAIFEALLGIPRGAPESWYRYVRERAGELTPRLRPVYLPDARPVFPNVVAPNPIAPRAGIDEELAALRAAAPELVREEIDRAFPRAVPEAYRRLRADPPGELARLSELLERCWDAVLAPLWPGAGPVLDRELLTLGSRVVAEGPGALLARLHPRIRYEDGALRWTSHASRRTIELPDRALVLVPMLSGPDAVMSATRTDQGVFIAYAAPGAALLWEAADAGASDALCAVLGQTRARVLLAVAVPGTTADVAQQLGISASLASHHLKALERLGLVDGTRFGHRVYYRMTLRGQRLRDALES